MENTLIQLRPLCDDDESAFKNAFKEFLIDKPRFDFAIQYDESLPFSEYVRMVNGWASGLNLKEGCVPNTFLYALIDTKIIGRVSIRHELNDYLAVAGGHIGYGVVPSERNKGYGTILLKRAIPIAFSLGISHILVTCDYNNTGSRKIIERNGGFFDGMVEDPKSKILKRRYWIEKKIHVH